MLNKQGLFSQNERYRRDPRGLGPCPRRRRRASRSAWSRRVESEVTKPKAEEHKGSRLIVGPDIKLKGAEITDCDTLVVEGRVEASMDARVIQIAEGGSFHGTVGVDIAEIRGRFDGEMTARKALIIHPGGRVAGKIHYGKIVIEDGGELTGDVGTITSGKPATVAAATKPRSRPRATSLSLPPPPAPVKGGGERRRAEGAGRRQHSRFVFNTAPSGPPLPGASAHASPRLRAMSAESAPTF